jgi:hypothetical protein
LAEIATEINEMTTTNPFKSSMFGSQSGALNGLMR